MTSLTKAARALPKIPKVIDMSSVLGVKVFCEDVPAADLVDQPLTVEAEFAPGARSGEHVHPNQEESFEVLFGILDVFADGRWRRLQLGESVRIPKGTVHGFRNSTETAARALNTHDPGLRIQEYWERMEQLIQQRKVTGMSGLKNGIYLSLHLMQFRREVVLVRPPDWFLRALAKLGAAFGFRLT
jgi:mannose-6-phosphate isomerase-like protein (cupin superfamily)